MNFIIIDFNITDLSFINWGITDFSITDTSFTNLSITDFMIFKLECYFKFINLNNFNLIVIAY